MRMLTLFNIIAIAIAVYAVAAGYRKGFVRQSGWLCGLLCGAMASRAFGARLADFICQSVFDNNAGLHEEFIASLSAATITFGIFFITVGSVVTLLVRFLPHGFGGILDSLGGAASSLLIWMTWLSIGFGFFTVNDDGSLLKRSCDDDGNMIELVLSVSPALLGHESARELSRRTQLREARKISQNINESAGVNDTDGEANYSIQSYA